MSRKLTYDTWLFGAAMLIVVVGMVMIYSASAIITMQKVGSDNPYYFITRQAIWLLAGGALMLTLMHVNVARLRCFRHRSTARIAGSCCSTSNCSRASSPNRRSFFFLRRTSRGKRSGSTS
jgi:cell division protein FtsW (lipid II flippase)